MGCFQSKEGEEDEYDNDDLVRYRTPLMTLEQRELIKIRIENQVKHNKNGRECKLVQQASQSTLTTASTSNSTSSLSTPPRARPRTISTTPIISEEEYSDNSMDDDSNEEEENDDESISVDGDSRNNDNNNNNKQRHLRNEISGSKPPPQRKIEEQSNAGVTDTTQKQQQQQQKESETELLRKEKLRRGIQLIQDRLRVLQLCQIGMLDDGNCQFRSIAHQLYGNADRYHYTVRMSVVEYMKQHKKDFDCYFSKNSSGGADSWNRYVKSMKHLGTWGDELTLRAASNRFRCTIHIISSELEHYYVCYKPDNDEKRDYDNKKITTTSSRSNSNKKKKKTAVVAASTARKEKTTKEVDNATTLSAKLPSSNGDVNNVINGENNNNNIISPCKDIFLAYLSPLHYNSIRLIVPENEQQSQQATTTVIRRNTIVNNDRDDALLEVDA